MSSSTREVVTFQVGHYANFVGAHWWNIQESSFVYTDSDKSSGPKEINHDVLFREGKNSQGDVTYTPRLIVFDLKGSLRTLKEDGVLYDSRDQDEDVKWSGDVTLHKSESHRKNDFLQDLEKEDGTSDVFKDSSQDEMDVEDSAEKSPHVFGKKLYNLDDSVSVWSDFLRLHLHPRSVQVVEEYVHNSEQLFDVYGYGEQAIATQKAKDDIEDKIHFFLEECDNLQGVQLLVDDYNGFGGLGSCLAQDLSDEIAGKSIMSFAVSPSVFPHTKPINDSHRVLTTALSYVNLLNHSSFLLPLSTSSSVGRKLGDPVNFPYLNYNSGRLYHSSAVLAASLDTMTLPYRLNTNPSYASQISNALTPLGRKVLALQTALPLPLNEGRALTSCLQSLGDSLPWRPITPMSSADVLPFCQSVVLRGSSSYEQMGVRDKVRPRSLSTSSSPAEILESYLSDVCCDTANAGTTVYQPLKVTAPFPHIFSSKISRSGQISKTDRNVQQHGVESIPVMTSLQSTLSTGKLLEKLHDEAANLDLHKFHKFTEAGLEVEEFKQALETLQSMAHNYQQPSDMETT